MNESADMRFEITPYMLRDQLIARLPTDVSKQLPSRGQVAVKIFTNERDVVRVLEPDGNWGHWMRIDEQLQHSLGVQSGVSYTVRISTTKGWPEPVLPHDLKQALDAAPQKVARKWQDITSMARWEWVRWISATASKSTRAARIEKTISKLNGSHRRPCCFNLAACTDPQLSKSGRLIDVL